MEAGMGVLTLPVEPLSDTQLGVGLWVSWLDFGTYSAQLYEWLSYDERARAGSFLEAQDGDRFVACRGILRGLLSDAVGVEPRQLRFEGQLGTAKPRLAWPAAPVSFNLSHSAGRALFGIAQSVNVEGIGVDIERVLTDVDFDAVAARYFSVQEQNSLRSIVNRSERLAAYFACWTRKEAVVKGMGVGLSMPLHLFDVPVFARGRAEVIVRCPGAKLVDGWMVQSHDLGPGWAAAVSTLVLNNQDGVSAAPFSPSLPAFNQC